MEKTHQKTTLYPMVEFKPGTFELDEFDCVSIFVLVGEEKALVIDAGMGIGDLLTAVHRITEKSLVLVLSHGHIDHIQQAWQFGRCFMNSADLSMFKDDVVRRKKDARLIAQRSNNIYPYDLDRDVTPWPRQPEVLPLEEGQTFDLGGGRIIRTYAVPGHSKGSMMFLDEKTRSLFVGDALNNFILASMSMDPSKSNYTGLETTLASLEKIHSLKDKYDGIYNGHHDYRALGMPLKEDVLDNAMALCRELLAGKYELEKTDHPIFKDRDMYVARKGENVIAVDPRFLPPPVNRKKEISGEKGKSSI